MRPRKWVIAFALILFAFTTALYQVSRYLDKNRNLENLLIQGISPYIKGSFDVGKIRFGLFSAHLQDVVLDMPMHSFSAKIHDIKVGFSLSKIIKYRGDISRSINKIILIGPVIDLSIIPKPADSSQIPAQVPEIMVSVPNELPLRHLVVKKGVLRFSDVKGNTFVLGEQLSGKLTDKGTETSVDLSGKLGSDKNNLSLQGNISWTGDKNRLSLSLNGASIKRPVSFKDLIITGGALSGAVEFDFPDSVSLSNLDANGWITLKGGICRFKDGHGIIDSADMHMSMSGTEWKIDSLKCLYQGIRADLRGGWNLARGPSTSFKYTCT